MFFHNLAEPALPGPELAHESSLRQPASLPRGSCHIFCEVDLEGFAPQALDLVQGDCLHRQGLSLIQGLSHTSPLAKQRINSHLTLSKESVLLGSQRRP